jgi:hypothetical protein
MSVLIYNQQRETIKSAKLSLKGKTKSEINATEKKSLTGTL